MDLNNIELTQEAFEDIQRIVEGTVGDLDPLNPEDVVPNKLIPYIAQVLKVSYTIGVRDGILKAEGAK